MLSTENVTAGIAGADFDPVFTIDLAPLLRSLREPLYHRRVLCKAVQPRLIIYFVRSRHGYIAMGEYE